MDKHYYLYRIETNVREVNKPATLDLYRFNRKFNIKSHICRFAILSDFVWQSQAGTEFVFRTRKELKIQNKNCKYILFLRDSFGNHYTYNNDRVFKYTP